MRGETLLQRCTIKALLHQHREALADAEGALDELLSDRALTRDTRASPMAEASLRNLIRGRRLETSLLLVMAFESAAAESKFLQQEHEGFWHNADELLRLLRHDYESGAIKFGQDAEQQAAEAERANDSAPDLLAEVAKAVIMDQHPSDSPPFDRLVTDCRRRCLAEQPEQRGSRATASPKAKAKAKKKERPVSAPRSHALPEAGTVPMCDSLGRSYISWACKRGTPPPSPSESALGHPRVVRGTSATRLRQLSRSQTFKRSYPLSAEWLSHARPSTAGVERTRAGARGRTRPATAGARPAARPSAGERPATAGERPTTADQWKRRNEHGHSTMHLATADLLKFTAALNQAVH